MRLSAAALAPRSGAAAALARATASAPPAARVVPGAALALGMTPATALAVLLALFAPAAASADSIAYRGSTLAYTGDAAADQIGVTRGGASLDFSAGAGQSLLAPPTCVRRGPDAVSCPAATVTSLTVDLLAGDDSLTVALQGGSGPALGAHGGDGDDVLDASAAPAGALSGDEGNDRLLAGTATFDLYGGPGADELRGGPAGSQTRFLAGGAPDGPDQLLGGPGLDTVTYEGRGAPVRLTQDGADDDGEAGEGDNVASSVEILLGGSGADTLAGGPGPNSLSAGAGDDTVHARDGALDQVDCGEGADTAVLDVADVVEGCEVAQRPPLTVAVTGLARHASWGKLRRGLRFTVTPSAPARWRFVLLAGHRALARRTLPLGTGRRTVTLKPRRLGARRRLSLRVRITAVSAEGLRTVVVRRLVVR